MRRLSGWTPTPALLLSAIALFVALGGTGYAVVKLPKNSVKAKQIAPRAVGSSEAHNLTVKDFRSSQRKALRGPRGATGPQGQAGAAGTALAFAHVLSNGTLDPAGSSNLIVATSGAGTYCLALNGTQTARHAVATLQSGAPLGSTVQATVDLTQVASSCPLGSDVFVRTADETNAAAPLGFYVLLN